MWANPKLFTIDECEDCGIPLPKGETICSTCNDFTESMSNICGWCGDLIPDQNSWRWQELGNACDECDAFFDERAKEELENQ